VKRFAFAVLLLLAAAVQGGQLVVSSLPDTVNQTSHSAALWDTITIAGTKLTSTTNGVLFANSTHHWLLLLATDTVIFGTDSTYRPSVYSGARGIDVGSNCHDITIKGGYILHQPANVSAGYDGPFVWADTVNAYNLCIDAGYASYNILVDSVKEARVRGYNSHVMAGGQKMIRVNACRFFNDCYAYSSRELFLACCIKVEASDLDLLAGEYHYRITNSYLEDNAHAAVYANSNNAARYTVVQLDGDTIKVDSRNRRYTTYSGTGASSTNAYGVQFTYGGPGSYINNCVITSGTSHSGGRGIQLVSANGTQANLIVISYNKISCHEGLNVEFGTLYYGCGVKIRQDCKGVWLHHNAIAWTGDITQTVGAAYQPKGEALMYQMGFDVGSPFGGPYYVTIENNACSTFAVTNVNNSNYELAAVAFESGWYLDPTVVYRNNKTYSMQENYITGQYDGGGNHLRMTGDSCYSNVASLLPHRLTFNISDYRGAIDNWATDFYYGTGTSPTSVGYYFQGQATSSGAQNITIKRTVPVKIIDLNGNPLSGATVSIQNAYLQSWSLGTTGGSGTVSRAMTYQYSSRAGDSSAFNPQTITVTRTNLLGVVESQTKRITVSSATDTVYIPMSQVDNVVANRDYGAASTWATLGIPREQVAWYKGDTLVFISNGTNRVNQWGSGTITAFTNGTVWNYDHNHMELRNDTLWVFGRRMATYGGNPSYIPPSGAVGSDTCWVNLWRVSGATPTLLASGVVGTGTGWGNRYDINMIFTGAHIGTSSNMIGIMRFGGNASTSGNIMWYSSANNGLTWTYRGQIASPMVQNVQVRFDIDRIFAGTAWVDLANQLWVNIFSYGSNPQRFYSATYEGTTWSSAITMTDPQTYSASPTTPCWQRCISTQTDTLGWYHVAWTDNANPSHILHAYRKPGAATWYQDTVETMGWQMPGAEAYTAFSLNEKHNRLTLLYTRRLSATANNNAAVVRQWSNPAEMWGPGQQIGTATGVIAMAGSQSIPKTVDSCRSAFLYTSGTRAYILSLIDTTAGAAPPEQPIDTIIRIADAFANEGDSMAFSITLSPALSGNVTYNYATIGGGLPWGTAIDCHPPVTPTSVYWSEMGTRTILAGATTDQIKIRTCRDGYVNPDLWFSMILSGFSIAGVRNASTDSLAIGTVINIDTLVTPSQPGKKVFGTKK